MSEASKEIEMQARFYQKLDKGIGVNQEKPFDYYLKEAKADIERKDRDFIESVERIMGVRHR